MPIADELGRGLRRKLRHPNGVGQRVAHRGPPFAVRGKLWPILGDRRVIVDHPALGQYVRARSHETLGRGPGGEQGIAVHPPARVAVGHPRPGVHHQLAIHISRHLQAQLLSGVDQVLQDFMDLVVHRLHQV